MSIQTALVAIKTANATLNTLIGTRFHPDALPQTVTLPAVRFQVISRTRPDYSFARRAQISSVRVQLDAYVQSARSGGTVSRTTIRSALIGAFLPVTRVNGSYGGETIYDIRVVNEMEGIEQLGTNIEADRITMDLIVDIQEP